MTVYFDIHGVVNLKFIDVTRTDKIFFDRELGYFESSQFQNADIIVNYLQSISIPNEAIKLLNDFYYLNGKCYFKKNGKLLIYNISNWLNGTLFIKVEVGFPAWWTFYAIEKTLMLLMTFNGYCPMHASAFSNNQNSKLISGLQGAGKTLTVLDKCIRLNHKFYGDDILFIDNTAKFLSYPRAVNFNEYHGVYYNNAKKAFYKKLSFTDKFKFTFKKAIKKILSIYLKQHAKTQIYRLPLSEIYPKIETPPKVYIEELYIFLNQRSAHKWETNRVATFLIENLNYELTTQISGYLSALKAYGCKDIVLANISLG